VIASVGTGMMGQLAHIGNYARLRDDGACEIAGVTDLQRSLAEAVAEKYRIPAVYVSLDELLADPAVDAVTCIQQWPNNYKLVKQILQAGKSVITEKPMVGRVDEAEELVSLASEKGVLYTVGFMKRYDLGVELAKRLIGEAMASGEFGELRMVDALCDGGDWLHNVEAPIRSSEPVDLPPLQPTYPDRCQSPLEKAAYDWLLNIFSHNVNLCHHLLGQGMTPLSARFHGTKTMAATLDAGDVLVTLRGAMSKSPEWRELTTLTFERGQIQVKTPTPMHRQLSAEVRILKDCGSTMATTAYHAPAGWAFYRQAEGFVQALAGEAPLRTTAEDALQDARVLQRIIEIAEIA
jgi:predicted dehydrogenase